MGSVVETSIGTRSERIDMIRVRSRFDWYRDVIAPVLLFVLTRLAQLLVLAWMKPAGTTINDKLLSWDGGWFLTLAQDGYPHGYSVDGTGAADRQQPRVLPALPVADPRPVPRSASRTATPP